MAYIENMQNVFIVLKREAWYDIYELCKKYIYTYIFALLNIDRMEMHVFVHNLRHVLPKMYTPKYIT